nr:MAG TPA: hypothetical protein [Caudoviricetes sp.]
MKPSFLILYRFKESLTDSENTVFMRSARLFVDRISVPNYFKFLIFL